jgi:dGTPase
MEQNPRRVHENYEEVTLAPYASKAKNSKGRTFGEQEDDYRTCYQRDRDRIIYTTAFKKLQYKTQVFVVHEGDFHRTRLTHTLEVMQHARTFARVLRVNEDLVESIALAHDLGHAPFGHAGEEILADLLKDFGGFDHNLHSLRIVDDLERRYPDFPGLNLTFETREGLARHLTRFDQPKFPAEFAVYPQASIETQIVNISDSLAFAAHDLDDALRVGLVAWEELQNSGILKIQEIMSAITGEEKKAGQFSSQMKTFRLNRHLINHFNTDLIIQTQIKLSENQLSTDAQVRSMEQPVVLLSQNCAQDLKLLIEFLYHQVYKHPTVLMMAEKGKMILEKLFRRFWDNPKLLPASVREKGRSDMDNGNLAMIIGDYLAGLTDRQAMDVYEMMFEPYTKVMSYGFGK